MTLPIFYNAPSDAINASLNGKSIAESRLTNRGQILIIACTNFIIQNTATYNGIAGYFFYDSHNATIINSRSKDNFYGFYFGFNSTNITIYNSTIQNSLTNDLYLDEYANVTIVNSTFNKLMVANKSPSNLTIQWYMHVKVIYGFGTQQILIPGANVKVLDKFGKMIYNGTTKSDGTAKFIKCTESIISDTGKTSFNMHNVTASKIHFQPNYAGFGVTIDDTKWVQIRLTDNHDPLLFGGISPEVTHNPKPTLTWNSGTDPDLDKLTYWFKIWNINNPDKILENKKTAGTSYTIKNNLTYGDRYKISVNASDPYGGWSKDITGTLDVINDLPTTPKIVIKPLQTDFEPSRNRDLNCTIWEPSKDSDKNPVDKIKYNFIWYKDGVLQSQLSIWNSTQDYHVLSYEHTKTGEVWTCEVSATDGIGLSGTVTDSRIIRNTPPRIRKPPKSIIMDEDTIDFESINLDNIFTDDDNDKLTYSLSITGNNITLELQQDNSVLIAPASDWSGYELAKFTASDGDGSVFTVIKITVMPVNDQPYAEIIEPMTNSPFPFNETQGIKLEAIFMDPDLEFGDILNFTWKSNISGYEILGHSAVLKNVILPVGVHKLDFIVRDSAGLTASDSIIVKIYDPNNSPPDITWIKLIYPFDGQILDRTDVTLYWEPINLTPLEAESVLYDIYIYKRGEPKQIFVEKYVGTNITIPALEDEVTYFWTIIPFRNNTQGLCLNGIWEFTLNLTTPFNYSFEVHLDTDVINLDNGETKNYTLTIENTGNILDSYKIKIKIINNSKIQEFITLFNDRLIIMPGQTKIITLSVQIPENFTQIDIYDWLRIIVISELNGNRVQFETNLTIIVDNEPITPEPIEDQDTKKVEPELLGNFLLILGILILILVLVVLFMLFLNVSLHRQLRLNYPVKITKVMSKERNLDINELEINSLNSEPEPESESEPHEVEPITIKD